MSVEIQGTQLLAYVVSGATVTAYCVEHPDDNVSFAQVNMSDQQDTIGKWLTSHMTGFHLEPNGGGNGGMA